MADAEGNAEKLAELKKQLAENTAKIRKLKEEGKPFMEVVAEIEKIKTEMKALGGKKSQKGGKDKKKKGQQQQAQKGGGGKGKQKQNSSNAGGGRQKSNKGGEKGPSAQNKGQRSNIQNVSVQTTNQVVGIFSHLKKEGRAKKLATSFSRDERIHPAVIKMGLKFSQGILDSVNSRTVGMLSALKNFIADVEIDQTTVFSLELGKLITWQINHLVTSRRHTLAMGNVINWLKSNISLLDSTLSHEQAKAKLCESIDYFIQARISVASDVIVDTALGKIQDGDVILTVSRYNVVEKILMRLTEYVRGNNLNIRIVVTDSPPDFHGKRMIKKIASAGIHCTYAPLNALSYVMQDVTKVFIGASALAANGAVIAHAGSALVGMLAKTQNIPVLVCVETYKFCERVQVDAIVENELSDIDQLVFHLAGDPEDRQAQQEAVAAQIGALNGAPPSVYCKPCSLGLIYDLTPAEFVTALVTEVGIIPPTSVPVIIRETKDRQSV